MVYTEAWKDIDPALIRTNKLNLQLLKNYWILPVGAQKTSTPCCNCFRTMRIFASGLCQSCYVAGKDLRGLELLNAMDAKRAQLIKADEDDVGDFQRPKVVGSVAVQEVKPEKEKTTGEEMPSSPRDNVGSIDPVVKHGVTVELGVAEIEFKSDGKSVEIKVSDDGEMLFIAKNIDVSLLQTIAKLSCQS